MYNLSDTDKRMIKIVLLTNVTLLDKCIKSFMDDNNPSNIDLPLDINDIKDTIESLNKGHMIINNIIEQGRISANN